MSRQAPSFLRDGADWLDVVESAYAAEGDLPSWGNTLFEVLKQRVFRDQVAVVMLRHSETGRVTEMPFCVGSKARWATVLGGWVDGDLLSPEAVRAFGYPRTIVHTNHGLVARGDPSARALLESFTAEAGIGDSLAVVLHPEPGGVLILSAPSAGPVSVRADDRRRLTWLGLHVEAALRLRMRPHALRAVVGPDGRVAHHEPGAPPKVVLDGAVEMVRDAQRKRRSGGEALALWKALVAGELSVVERTIGTRPHYFFFANPPHRQPFQALSAGEQDAIAAICRASSNKGAAYELGISEAALSLRLASASAKLGSSSRTDLVRIAAMLTRDPRARFERSALTASEEHVLELLRGGLGNAEIAKIRARSARTIANQVASLLRKTQSPNRLALAVKATQWASAQGLRSS